MNTTHRESLLDSALEESFPASDPISVFAESPRPLDAVPERSARPERRVAWKAVAATLPVVLGLVGQGVRFWYARKERALRTQRQQRLVGVAAATALVSVALAAHATWRARSRPTPSDDVDEYPLFI